MIGITGLIAIPLTVALIFLSIFLFMKAAKTEEGKYTVLGFVVLLCILFGWWLLMLFITQM